MENKEIKAIKKKIIPVLKKYKVTKAGIFGSFARGEQKKNSDIDILVNADNCIGLIEFIRLKAMLQNTLKKKVDLVEYETIRPELREAILRDEIVVLA